MLISCGALRTLEILQPLEQRCRVPMVSSMPHAMRAGVRLLGFDGRYPGPRAAARNGLNPSYETRGAS